MRRRGGACATPKKGRATMTPTRDDDERTTAFIAASPKLSPVISNIDTKLCRVTVEDHMLGGIRS